MTLVKSKPSYNIEWALRVGKDEFVKQLSEAYPDLDMGAEYDAISPPDSKKVNLTKESK